MISKERIYILLNAITKAQQSYISGQYTPKSLFKELLEVILAITQSEYGFIGKVLYEEDGKPFLRTYAISDIAWDKASKELYDSQNAMLDFKNLETLFGKVLTTQKVIIANDAPNDARAGGIPKGHPPLQTFLGVPLFVNGEMIGMFGLANAPQGYVESVLATIESFTNTCAMLIWGINQAEKEKQKEIELRKSKENVEQTIVALKKNQQNLKKIQKIAKVGYYEWYPYTQKLMWSKEVYQIYEVDFFSFEPTAENTAPFLHPEDLELLTKKNEELKEKAIYEPVTIRINTLTGKLKYITIATVDIKKDEQGRVVRLFGVMQDVTAQKQQEEELKLALEKEKKLNEELLSKEDEVEKSYFELGKYTRFLEDTRQKLKLSEQKYKYLFDKSPLPMMVYDLTTLCFLNVNRAAKQLYGYNSKEFADMTILDIRPSTERDKLKEHISQRDNENKKLNKDGVWRHTNKKGEEIQAEVFSHAIEYEGKKSRLVLINDVTEKLYTQRKLVESQLHLASILNATYQSYYLVDKNYKVLKFNKEAYRSIQQLFDKELKEGDVFLEYGDKNAEQDFKGNFNKALSGQQIFVEREVQVGGKTIFIDIQYLPAYDENGKVFAVTLIFTDITARKKAEKEKQELLDNLANFAFMTSHNLRRPLANILGLVSLFDTEDDDFNRMLIEKLKFSSKELDKIIHDMNDLLKHKEMESLKPPISQRISSYKSQ